MPTSLQDIGLTRINHLLKNHTNGKWQVSGFHMDSDIKNKRERFYLKIVTLNLPTKSF